MAGTVKAKRHGQAVEGRKTPMYHRWMNMRRRCCDKKTDHAGRYFGRGIKVCARWQNSFQDFLADVLAEIGEPPTKKHQLDRRDNDADYEPGNIRWATREEQQRNTARTHFITFKDKTQCLADWAIELGIPRQRLSRRIHLGWDIERAFTT